MENDDYGEWDGMKNTVSRSVSAQIQLLNMLEFSAFY